MNRKVSVAPMMDCTDRHERFFLRLISKSGTPILPSKRARKSPEKIQVSQEDLAELSQTAKPDVEGSVDEENISDEGNVSLDEVSKSENKQEEDAEVEANVENNDTSNS